MNNSISSPLSRHADNQMTVATNPATTPDPSDSSEQEAPFALDADELKNASPAELRRQITLLRQQLTEAQRLATIGTISAIIAHEFNNLLTPILSYSQIALNTIEKGKPDDELIKKALTKSFNSADKAGKICASMLGLARGESSFQHVSIQKLVDEVLLVMARDPQKDGLALRVQVQPDLCVHADPIQLEQVLLNLLINARHAMSGRAGSLTIKAHNVANDDSQIRLQVIDTGPGIPEQLLPKIFQPFFTTKSNSGKKGESKGTGLGLAICKEIVEHHQGHIEVESTVGKGTTFSIILPKAA